MKRLFSIAPWLMELINPPPRASMSLLQKTGRVLLVTLTLLTLCVIAALALSLGCFVWQRSREVFLGIPQLRNALTILAASIVVNFACIYTLLRIKRLDEKLIPKASNQAGLPPPARSPAMPGPFHS